MSSRIASRRGPLVAGCLAAAAMAPAIAQSPAQGLLDNRFVFNAGAFVVGSDVKGNLNGTSADNPEIDFDATFGKADDATRGRLDALWRITPKHHVRFLYFNNSNTRSNVLDEDTAWGDYVFKAGSSVEAKDKFEVYELTYEYAFLRRPDYEISASLGVHVTDFWLRLSGNADVLDPDGNVISTEFSARTASAKAPLPVIGLRAGWVVAPNWYIDAQGQIFSLNSGDYSGNWSDLRVGATWMFTKNIGIGLGYNRFYTRVKVEKSDFDGRIKLGYQGLQAYLTGTF